MLCQDYADEEGFDELTDCHADCSVQTATG